MAEEKGHQVTELKYRGQKSKASKYMNIVEAFVNQLGEDRSEVESYAERQRIMDPLAQAETAIHTLEEYLAEHEAWEFHEKEKAEDFIDEELQRQKADYKKLHEDFVTLSTSVNKLIKKFDRTHMKTPTAASATASTSQARRPTSPGGSYSLVLREDDAYRLNDSIKPEKLSMNDDYLVFINWERSIKAYFQMNAMEKKPRNVQVSAFYNCCDETLVRDISVHFSSLPDVPMMDLNVPQRRRDTYLDYVKSLFESLYPKGCRIFTFFTEQQSPTESPSQYLARMESLSVAAEIENMRYDDWMKHKYVSGLQHDTEVRSKLLKRVDNLDFKALKSVVAEIEAARKMSDAVERKVNQIAVNPVNALSAYQKEKDYSRQQSYIRGGSQRGRFNRPQPPQHRPQQ